MVSGTICQLNYHYINQPRLNKEKIYRGAKLNSIYFLTEVIGGNGKRKIGCWLLVRQEKLCIS